MIAKSFSSKVLVPGYGSIVLGSVIENALLRTNWFQLGSIFGFLWLLAGCLALILAFLELRKGESFMLVQTGPFAVSRNPLMAANLLGIMPGLCLLLNTNLGILGIGASMFLFFKHIDVEEEELEGRFGEVYQAYRDRVSLLLPCFPV